jgi:hypothetical protein
VTSCSGKKSNDIYLHPVRRSDLIKGSIMDIHSFSGISGLGTGITIIIETPGNTMGTRTPLHYTN